MVDHLPFSEKVCSGRKPAAEKHVKEKIMHNRFIELVSAWLAEAGIEAPIVPSEDMVTVPLGDFSFSIALLKSRKAVVFQAVAGVVPQQGREAFYAELLTKNSLFSGTRGAAIGIDDDAVTVQSFVSMEDLSDAYFSAQAMAFLESLADVMAEMPAIAERAASAKGALSQEEPMFMPNMIRI